MLTEEEAKTKWCPYTFGRHREDGGYGQVEKCVASECMSWRFIPQGENYSENMATGDRTYLTPVGYCGLAGKP